MYPNTREGYSWQDEDWWICIYSQPAFLPELMGGILEWEYHVGAPWNTYSDFIMEPLHVMYKEVRKERNRDRRFELYRKANEHIADHALGIFTVAPVTLYGVNRELDFAPQVSQYLYLEHSSVTENHWSLRGQNN